MRAGQNLTGLNNPIGSCRHLYSKTISLVGMLADINKKQGTEEMKINEDNDDDMGSEEMEKALQKEYSSTKIPTMRRQDFYKEQNM